MTQQKHPSSLTDYSARTWTDGEDVTDTLLNAEFGSSGSTGIQTFVAAINDSIQDVNSCHAATAAPSTQVAGQIFFNTDSDLWFGDPDAGGADDQFLTELTAYQGDLATAGTDTFKLAGVTQRLITENALTATGTLVTATIAAGVLGSNGQALHFVTTIQKTGASGTATVNLRMGATPATQFAFSFTADTTGSYLIEGWITRTSTTAADIIAYALSEAEGDSVAKFAATTDTVHGGAQSLRFDLTAVSAGTVTFQGCLIEYLG